MEMLDKMVPWYKRWWGRVLMIIGTVAIILAGVFVFLIVKYWWMIQHGQGGKLAGSFTASLSNNRKEAQTIDRKDLETPDDPWLGRDEAPVVIVEFIDFKCPNCLRAAPIMRQVVQKYSNQIKYIVRDVPVESTHPGATELSELASCAHFQGRFWLVDDLLYREQNTLPTPLNNNEITRISADTQLDEMKLRTCLASNKAKQEVQQDYLDAIRFGVQGTPTFFINGRKIEGVIPLETWDVILNSIK